ncbi:MAG TPA: heterodisulfide reductase-related iron-sulfur binding cluster [Steroidobacteraceae bacterium]|nr:heterodisulfide reductase-related iron-sulfur binding cluster [Steroidobacteraceae bacterium]
MVARDAVTRVLFEQFSPAAIGAFYAIAGVAVAVFGFGVYVQIRKYRRGAAAEIRGGLLGRFGAMVGTLLSHRTVARRDRGAGEAHRLIFYGFVLLFLGTSTITLDYDVVGPLLGVHFWHGDFYLWFSLVLDVAGVLLSGGLLYMMYRRGWLKPPKLDYARPDRKPGDADYDRSGYRREDWAFLWTLLLIAITGYVLEAARLVWLAGRPDVWDYRWWSPVGAIIADAMRALGLTAPAAAALRWSLWWFHGVLALAFIALIPYSKVKHIFTAAGSLLLRDPQAAQRLPGVPQSQERAGVQYITDLSWKQLLNLDACTKCGRCHEACPARAVGAPLSPRDVILSLREFANRTLESRELPPAAELDVHGKAPGQVATETLWSCRTCMACVEVCPVAIEHLPLIVQMRRKLVEDGTMDPQLQKTLQAIHKSGNSFGESKRKRPAWTKGLPFAVKDARKESVELLWFVGDYASFDPRNQKVTQTFASLLHQAGVDYGILYEAESNAGNDVRRVGEEGLYEMLATANIKSFSGSSFKSIVTTDPHSYNTIRNEYPDFGGNYSIEHYTTLVLRLLQEQRLAPKRKLGLRVTFHDPCHLGRFNKGYDAPRAILGLLGCELVEMGRCRANSFCCGAGGGRIWMPDPVGADRPAHNRMREAAAIPGLQVYVVSCPKDLTMFEDALKATGNEGKFVVKELIELIAEALQAEKSPATAVVAA